MISPSLSASLEIWRTFLEECAQKEESARQNWGQRAVEVVQDRLMARHAGEEREKNNLRERLFFGSISAVLASEKVAGLRQALEIVSQDPSSTEGERAKIYLDSKYPKTLSKFLVSGLMEMTQESSPDPVAIRGFMDETFKILESQADCPRTAMKIYGLAKALSRDPEIHAEADRHLDAFRGRAGLGRSLQKAAYSIDPLSLGVDILLMALSGGIGQLARAAYLARYSQAMQASGKVLLAGFAVESGVETLALGSLNTAKVIATQDIGKLDSKEAAKIYARAATMVPITKAFVKLGGHGMGLAGMVTSTQVYQGISGDEPAGGFNESLAQDLVGYVTFGAAQKGLRRMLRNPVLSRSEDLAIRSRLREFHLSMASLMMGGVHVPEIVEINGVKMAKIPSKISGLPDFYMAQNLVTNADFVDFSQSYSEFPYAVIGRQNGKLEVLFYHDKGVIDYAGCSEKKVKMRGYDLATSREFIFQCLVDARPDDQGVPNAEMSDVIIVHAKPKELTALKKYCGPNQPVNYIRWYQAFCYARWKGMDLPTDAQWLAAAQGPEGHPYGTATGKISRSLAHYAADNTADVGSYPPNSYGLHDMAGNLMQWTLENSARGSSYMTRADAGLRAAFRSGGYQAGDRKPDVGFRLVFNGEKPETPGQNRR